MSAALTITDAAILDDGRASTASIRAVGGRIAEVGAVNPQDGDTVVHAHGRTVVPGLIDAHFHAYGIGLDAFGIDQTPMSYVALAAGQRLRRALARGFTTVRDVAGGDIGLARAIEAGLIPAPRYFYSGAALSQTGGHGDPRPADVGSCALSGHITEVVDGVDAVRTAVRDRLRTGAHCIKVMASGGVVSPTDPIRLPQYSEQELEAICTEAARRHSYVAAHAYSPESIVHAVRAGVRTIEHGNLLDAAAAQEMATHGAFLVPTLVAYDAMNRRGAAVGLSEDGQEKNRQVFHAGQEAITTARAAGVAIGFGTDLMGDLEDDQLLGLRLQIEADGVDNVLRSATRVNADILGREDLGRIAPGAVADMIILDADPRTDAAALWDAERPRTVIQAGAVVG